MTGALQHTKVMLTSRLTRHLWLLSPCPLSYTSSALGIPSPSFSFLYNTPMSAMYLPDPLSFIFLSSSSHSPPSPVLSWPGPFCWPCFVYYFLFLHSQGASGCALPLMFNKNLPFNQISERSCPHFIQTLHFQMLGPSSSYFISPYKRNMNLI